MSQPLIDLQHISKRFDDTLVLDDLSLSVKENSFVTLLGPSGCGKTTVTTAILRALQRRGVKLSAFKCGPDYIDPMFHRAVLGVESHNLDLFFSAPQTARALYARHAAGHGAAVVEGAMATTTALAA